MTTASHTTALADADGQAPDAFIAQCASCPVFVAAADIGTAIPLMDEHADKTRHRLWALSSITRTEKPR